MAIAKPLSRKSQRIQEVEQIVRRRFAGARFEVRPVPDVRGVTGVWACIPVDPDSVEAEELRTTLREKELEILLSDGIHLLAILQEDKEARR